MSTLTIELSTAAREFVESQVASPRYGTVSDYLEDLIRRESEEAAELIRLAQEGDQSGHPVDFTPNEWCAHVDQLREKIRHSAE